MSIGLAETRNQVRFLSLGLTYGRRLQSGIYEYLRGNGMNHAEYNFLRAYTLRDYCMMGTESYYGNEHRISAGSILSCCYA